MCECLKVSLVPCRHAERGTEEKGAQKAVPPPPVAESKGGPCALRSVEGRHQGEHEEAQDEEEESSLL